MLEFSLSSADDKNLFLYEKFQILDHCVSTWKQNQFKDSTLMKRTKAGKTNASDESCRYWEKITKAEGM